MTPSPQHVVTDQRPEMSRPKGHSRPLVSRSYPPALSGAAGNPTPFSPAAFGFSSWGFRYVSFQFSPARYLRFRCRVLTPSKAGPPLLAESVHNPLRSPVGNP